MEHSQAQSIPATLEASETQPLPGDPSAEIVAQPVTVAPQGDSQEVQRLKQRINDLVGDRAELADIIARLRAELADVKPFPQLTRVQPADLVVIRFAAGEQTRRLRAAGFSIEDLKRAGFRYHFSGEWRAVRNETTVACAESIAEAKV